MAYSFQSGPPCCLYGRVDSILSSSLYEFAITCNLEVHITIPGKHSRCLQKRNEMK